VTTKPPTLERSLRPRTDEDWPALLDLWVAAWRATYSDIDFEARRDWLKRHVGVLEANGAKTLCLVQTELAGFVVIDAATGWVDQICVSPKHFGGGAADALIAGAMGVSPERILLDVNADNVRAIRFYERRGFTSVGAGASSLSGRPTLKMVWRAPLSSE
jgi:putative acetyltransferase